MFLHSTRLRLDRRRLRVAKAVVALVLTACGSDIPVSPAPLTDAATMFWAVELNHRAITLSTVAPYDTTTLSTTPVNDAHAPLTGLPAPTFTSTDSTRARVTANGLVTALRPGANIKIIASILQENLRHADTAVVTVTSLATPPILAALSIHPIPPDSAKNSNTKSLAARLTDTKGLPITGLPVFYTSSDVTISVIDRITGSARPIRPGRVTFVAAATAYGITKSDTLAFIVGYPTSVLTPASPRPNAQGKTVYGFWSDITVGIGAAITFQNNTAGAPPIDVVFDDSTHVAAGYDNLCAFNTVVCAAAGNIAPFSIGQDNLAGITKLPGFRERSFRTLGTFKFHSPLQGTSGTITVVKDP